MIKGTLNLAPPVEQTPSGSVWDYVSASRLNLWLKCPLAFKLRYLDGIRSPTTPNLFLGKQVHDALEFFYRHRQFGITLESDAVLKRITDSWDEAVVTEDMSFASAEEEGKLKVKAVDLVWAYLNSVPADEAKPVLVETSLECPLVDPATGEDLGISLLGIIDLVLGTDEGEVICDFKTAARSSQPLEIMHEIQLSCYSYMYRRMTGHSEAALEIRSLIKTKSPKIEIHTYQPRRDSHFSGLFAVIRGYLDDLDKRRFTYRPGFGCAMCDYSVRHCAGWNA
jgi:putative RecB family exonuclease